MAKKTTQVMTSPVVSVPASSPLCRVVDLMVNAGVGGLPVVDDDGAVVGMVTETDVVAATVHPACRPRALVLLAGAFSHEGNWFDKGKDLLACQVMTAPVITCAPDDTVEAAARRMRCYGVKRLPVVEDGRLVGIITRSDLLATSARPDDDVGADLEQCLQALPDEDHVSASVREGVVTLTGGVAYYSHSCLTARRVGAIPGVVAVVNQLTCPQSNLLVASR
jgi:CBS domain-containing protein